MIFSSSVSASKSSKSLESSESSTSSSSSSYQLDSILKERISENEKFLKYFKLKL